MVLGPVQVDRSGKPVQQPKQIGTMPAKPTVPGPKYRFYQPPPAAQPVSLTPPAPSQETPMPLLLGGGYYEEPPMQVGLTRLQETNLLNDMAAARMYAQLGQAAAAADRQQAVTDFRNARDDNRRDANTQFAVDMAQLGGTGLGRSGFGAGVAEGNLTAMRNANTDARRKRNAAMRAASLREMEARARLALAASQDAALRRAYSAENKKQFGEEKAKNATEVNQRNSSDRMGS